jgi:hypothetical protein
MTVIARKENVPSGFLDLSSFLRLVAAILWENMRLEISSKKCLYQSGRTCRVGGQTDTLE